MSDLQELERALAEVKRGPSGRDGRDGRDGIDGLDSLIPGPMGPRGLVGEKGIDGRNGIDGLDGKDGAPGVDGKDGRDGIDGKDGADGPDGIGIKGDAGPRGAPGPQGPKGDLGPMPRHEWEGTALKFEAAPGRWGQAVDLQGPAGKAGRTQQVGGGSAPTQTATIGVGDLAVATGAQTATFTAANAPIALWPQKWLRFTIDGVVGYLPWFSGAPPVIDLTTWTTLNDEAVVLVMPNGDSNEGQNFVGGMPVTDADAAADDLVTYVYHTTVGVFKFYEDGTDLSDMTISGDGTGTFTVSGPWAQIREAFSEWGVNLDLNITPITTTEIAGQFTLTVTDANGQSDAVELQVFAANAATAAFLITKSGAEDPTTPLPNAVYTIFPSGTYAIAFNDAGIAAESRMKVQFSLDMNASEVTGVVEFIPAGGTALTIISQTDSTIILEAQCLAMQDFIAGNSGDVLQVTPLSGEANMRLNWTLIPFVEIGGHKAKLLYQGVAGTMNRAISA